MTRVFSYHPELVGVVMCNRKSAVLNVGGGECEGQRVLWLLSSFVDVA